MLVSVSGNWTTLNQLLSCCISGLRYPLISYPEEMCFVCYQKYLALCLMIIYHRVTICHWCTNRLMSYDDITCVFDTNLIKLLVDSLVLSHFYCCLPVWGSYFTTSSVFVKTSEDANRAVHLCMHLKEHDIYCQLWLPPLELLIQYCLLCLTYHQFHQ